MSTIDERGDAASSDGVADAATLAAHAAVLVEANERLVVSMMLAQAEAETAAGSLREATRLAELDPLTGLPNRVLLLDRFSRAITVADRNHGKTAILFIDLDHFKSLNDSLGHAAGDATLKRVAECLLGAVRKADTVSRFGGDEFLVLLTEVSAAPGAALIAAKIIAAIADGGRGGAGTPSVTASIGISVYPDDGDDAQTLIELADAAMYRAKEFGGGYFLFHSAAASPSPREPHLREANTELLLSTLRGRDERDRAEESLQIALEAVGMGTWELDLASGRISGSSGVDLIFGERLSAAPEPLAAFVERFVEDDRDPVTRTFLDARTTGTVEFERRIVRASDGSLRWLHFKGKTIFVHGAARRIVGVVEDESERRSVEAQYRQSQKMEAVGQLTGGIAHDFNNLLLVIAGNLELLERRMPVDDRTTRLLTSARRAVAKGGKLNRQLVAFARRQELKMNVIDVATLLQTFEQLLKSAVGGAIVVTLVPRSDAWRCCTDAHQLEVAVLNLAINARDAMPDGGTLTVELENQTLTAAFASNWGGVAGEYLGILVSDTGVGMSSDVKARAFEPFFTTKVIGKATGLGLSQVHGFARQSDGFVSIADRPGGGTVVTIHLPRWMPDRSIVSARDPPAPSRSGNGGVVLVVEDNGEVRTVIHAMLDELDYRVLEAASADQALAMLSDGAVVDIVLLDVVMPGTSGVDLARVIRSLRPELPVLLMSGHITKQAIRKEAGEHWQVLRKPYTQAALSTAVEKLLKTRPVR